MTMHKIKLEVCADSVESALAAQQGGAGRIELCRELEIDGTTPSFAEIDEARRLLNIKIFVLIRPRGGDFVYNDAEFAQMQEEVHYCGQAGCHGVVIGMLTDAGAIDTDRCATLIAIAREYNMQVTFHRAFDHCSNLPESLELLVQMGCERVLTSGGQPTAMEGAEMLRHLVVQAGERIIVMPGGGLTPENVPELIKKTGAKEIHGSFRSSASGDAISRTDPEKVKKVISLL